MHEEKGDLTLNATMTQEQMSMSYDPSLTYVEFVKGVLLLRNKIEARREQLRNPFERKLQKVDKCLGKYQRMKKDKNVRCKKGTNIEGFHTFTERHKPHTSLAHSVYFKVSSLVDNAGYKRDIK